MYGDEAEKPVGTGGVGGRGVALPLVLIALAQIGIMLLLDALMAPGWRRSLLAAGLTAGACAPFLAARRRRRRRLEEEAAAHRGFCETVLESAVDLVTVIDARGLILAMSPSLKDVLGFEPEELAGSSAFALVHPDDLAAAREALARVIAEPGRTHTSTLRVRHKNGQWKLVESSARALPGCAGPGAVVAHSHDVTESARSQAEARLLGSIARVVLENEGPKAALARILAIICEETGWVLGEVWAPGAGGAALELREVWTVEQGSLDAYISRSRDFTFAPGVGLPGRVWRDGRPAWIPDVTKDANFPRAAIALEAGLKAAVGVPVPGEGQDAMVLCFYIREPRAAEDERLVDVISTAAAQLGGFLRRMALEGEMRKLAAAIEAASEMVVVTDPQGSIQYANPAFCSVTGYTRQEIIGRNPRVLKSGRHDKAFYERLWNSVLAGRAWNGRVTNRKKDGTLYDCDLRVFPVPEPSGGLRSLMALARDVTAESRLEGQLRQAQRMESLGLLAGGVAHDFNNLLTIIMGNNALLLDGLKDLPALRGFARQVKKTVERGAGLSRQLLVFSRKQFVFLKPLDLNAAASDAAELLRRLLGDDIAVSLDLAADLWPVRADAGQLSQVLVNLAVNARDAMPGGGTLAIATRNETIGDGLPLPPGDYVRLAVSDTGAGMDEATRSRIFEPFFTTKGPGKGTGLGLSIVYGIVAQSGGHVSAESSPGGGTTFRILLPRSTAAPAPDAAEPAATAGPSVNGGAVLVVEDNADLRLLVETALQAKGCHVLVAGGGSEAQDVFFANEREVRYLLTDLMLPDTSGVKLANSLLRAKPELKVVFMSGYADVGGEPLPAGAGLLAKPFSPDELLESLRRA
ncbi:MAG: PAS domain S-box protein [Elusimicrobia bacterium]|nr:PAS domain S-box protein [Elusimicrobiota bacterium]